MQTNLLLRVLAGAAVLTFSTEALAQGTFIVPGAADRSSRVGTRGANYLQIPIGGRANALGGSVTVQSAGAEALFWNPANIALSEGISTTLSYMSMYGSGSGISNIGAGAVIPVGQGALGLSLRSFRSGQIERTTENAPTGNDPVFPGTFQYTGISMALHYARNITDRLSAAGGFRFAREGIDFANTNFFGLDVSTRFRTGLYGVSLAAAISNIGGSGRWQGPGVERYITEPRYNGNGTGIDIPVQLNTRDVQMPTSFRLGILSDLYGDAEALFGASKVHAIQAELDFYDAIDTDLQPSVGIEYTYKKNLHLRGGKRWFNEQRANRQTASGYSFGGGVRFPFLGRSMSLDYAYVLMGDLNSNQVISFDFGN
ncbi:MAG: PorV/PorQ family protein [Gemmatimonadaceae bacterium]|nr:PorV/PorQ family protein [Gemmatimonadaceae bacterium]